jgi:hypothetical protein
MPFATTAKNLMLDALVLDRIRLHSGAPGAAGTDNALGAGLSAATFAAASSSSRALSSNVTVTGLAANQSVTHFSVWTNSGSVFRGSGTISSGDVTANAAGDYVLTTGTTVNLNDS